MATPDFVKPSWLNSQDVDTIHRRMMEALPSDIDDTDGGFPWDFTRPTALEKAELLEFHLVETLKIMHPQWAYAEWLDLHAASVQIVPRKPANAASGYVLVTGIAGTVIPAGYLFAVAAAGSTPAIEFATEEEATIGDDGTVEIDIVAVIPGPSGNVSADTIILMSRPMKGITSVTNPEPTTGGVVEESDDDLRERIMDINKAAEASFVGCDSDYIRWAKEVSGVGDAFVIPQWNPDVPNSVKLIVMDGNGDPANERIVESVYNHIMSPDKRIERKAPIGAILTVAAPTPKYINYTFKAVLAAGYGPTAVVQSFTESVRKYYVTAREEGVVKYNEVHAILTATAGVYDFTDLTMNGAAENIGLESDEYPITGTVDPGVAEGVVP